jgi:exodeoxyribonuclease VII small subunit
MAQQSQIDPEIDLESLSYEQAFDYLEQVVAALESGEQTLEASLMLYERGKALAQRCNRLLDQAELKVKMLSGEDLTDFKIEE